MTGAKTLIASLLVVSSCSGADGERVLVRAVSERTGAPFADVRVQVDEEAWQTTDAAGEASFADISAPFVVRLHETSNGWDNVVVLEGRTGTEVVVEISGPGPTQFHSAGASGTIAGRAGASPDSIVRVGFAPLKDWSASLDASPDDSFDVGVTWREPATQTAATFALHAWESDTAAPPDHYYGFARSSPLSFVENETISDVTLSLEAVEERTVEATVSLPAGAERSDQITRLWLSYAPYEQLTLVSDFFPPESFSIVVPSVPDAEAWLGVWANTRWHLRRIDLASTTVSLAPPAYPELLAPAEGATLSGSPLFRWTPIEPDGTSTLFVSCSSPDTLSGTTFLITRDPAEATEATLPTIPDVEIPATATCGWSVYWCAATDPSEQRCSWSLERAIAP